MLFTCLCRCLWRPVLLVSKLPVWPPAESGPQWSLHPEARVSSGIPLGSMGPLLLSVSSIFDVSISRLSFLQMILCSINQSHVSWTWLHFNLNVSLTVGWVVTPNWMVGRQRAHCAALLSYTYYMLIGPQLSIWSKAHSLSSRVLI